MDREGPGRGLEPGSTVGRRPPGGLLPQAVPQLVISPVKQEKDLLTMTLAGREAIPDLLSILLEKRLRVYRLAPQEANLEEVYFALNGGTQ